MTLRIIVPLFLCVSVAACSGPGSGEELNYNALTDERISMFEKSLAGWVKTGSEDTWTLEERMNHYKIKGLSVGVIHDYRIEWLKGYGMADSAENCYVDENTIFQAASISKALHGMAVLKLAQERRLDLDADINDYLKGWKFNYPDSSGEWTITTKNLLSHTAGLSLFGYPGYLRGMPLPDDIQILNGEPPANSGEAGILFKPGERYMYSSFGIMISQKILTDITGQDYEKYMNRNVLRPLGMKNSFFTQPPPTRFSDRLAAGYDPEGREIAGKYYIYPELAAVGLWTNPADLCRFIIETQLAYQGRSSKVISTEFTRLRMTPVIDSAGLGIFIDSRGSRRWFNHNGGSEGYTSILTGSFETGDGAVIMINSDNGAIMDEILAAIATVYCWEDYYQPVIKRVVEVAPALLGSYIGEYDLGGATATIKRGDNGLILNVAGQDRRLYFTSDTSCFVKEQKSDLSFVRDATGKVTGIRRNGNLFLKI